MALQLAPEEPQAGPWRVERLSTVVNAVTRRGADQSRPVVLANQAHDGASFDEDGWLAEELPFNTAQRTWERAGLIVCGSPEIPYDPGTQIVIGRPS